MFGSAPEAIHDDVGFTSIQSKTEIGFAASCLVADWAVVALVINPAGGGGGEGGQFVVLGEEPCMDEPTG